MSVFAIQIQSQIPNSGSYHLAFVELWLWPGDSVTEHDLAYLAHHTFLDFIVPYMEAYGRGRSLLALTAAAIVCDTLDKVA